MARTAVFDLAILDVNVAGRMITPVAETVELRKRPIIFPTGYAPADLRRSSATGPRSESPSWSRTCPNDRSHDCCASNLKALHDAVDGSTRAESKPSTKTRYRIPARSELSQTSDLVKRIVP